jgi:LacI family transcriptional regulator
MSVPSGYIQHHCGYFPMRAVFDGFTHEWAKVSDLPIFDAASGESARRSVRSPDCRGWVCTLRGPADEDLANELQIPLLNYSNRLGRSFTATNVFADEEEVGRLAAETFLRKGHSRFVAIGYERFCFSDERIGAFAKHLEEAGKPVLIRRLDPFNREDPLRHVSTKRKTFRKWFDEIELPAAFFCVNDEIAIHVLSMAESILESRAWLLSVAGVDDSGALFNVDTLSSIQPNFRGIGKVLAERLGQALGGKWEKGLVQRVGGAKWIERETTWGGPGSRNPLVARSVRFVNQALAKGESPTVSLLAHELGVSRRTLLSRFRDSTDRTLRDYLIEERVRYAAKLLRETDRSIADIALSTGFSKQSNLSHRFREFHGMTPREFRQCPLDPRKGGSL